MKIAELKTFIVGNPPPQHGGRYFLFVKLTTDCGIDGIGEVYAATFGPRTIAAMIEDVFARHVEGRDPLRIEAMSIPHPVMKIMYIQMPISRPRSRRPVSPRASRR